MLDDFELIDFKVKCVGGPRDGQMLNVDSVDWRTLAANEETRLFENKGKVLEITGPVELVLDGVAYSPGYDEDGNKILRAAGS